MSKNPHANFTPDLEPYSGVGPFRFWCQMALPLTYDDSLSYYELLCKVVNYINNLISDVSNAEKNIDDLLTAYNELEKYVNDYFDNLDLEQELIYALDAMVESGELDEILSPIVGAQLPDVVGEQIDDVVADQIGDTVADQIDEAVADQLPIVLGDDIPDIVTGWLNDNVTPVGSAVVVDNSLSISGAAADAKITGVGIRGSENTNYNERIFKYDTSLWVEGGISSSSGVDTGPGTHKRMKTSYLDKNIDFVKPLSGYRVMIAAYENDGTYVGAYDGSAFITSATWITTPVSLHSLSNLGYKYRIVGSKTDDSLTISLPDDAENILFGYYCDTSLTLSGFPADSKTCGDKINDVIKKINGGEVEYSIDLTSGGYYAKSQMVIGEDIRNSYHSSSNSKYCVIDIGDASLGTIILELDELTTNSSCGFGFADDNNKAINVGTTSTELSYDEVENKYISSRIKIPENAKYLYFSAYQPNSTLVYTIVYPSAREFAENIPTVFYVDTNGDDINNGLSPTKPKLTVNNAIENGAKIISIAGGEYSQTIDLSKVKDYLKIACREFDKKVTFVHPDSLISEEESAVSGYTKVYSCEYTDSFGENELQIFQNNVNDLNTEISDGERHPLERGKPCRCEDTQIIKCSSDNVSDALNEIENFDGYKWYYDSINSVLYFSRPETVTSSHSLRCSKNSWALFTGNNRAISLEMCGISVKYEKIDIRNLSSAILTDCSCGNINGAGAFMWDKSVGLKLYRCEAYRTMYSSSTGDGFNAHSSKTGDAFAKQTTSFLFDCWAHDNNDDGYSDHERCETTIYGGLYEYNGAGVTPAVGSHCTCYNVYSRFNTKDGDFYYTGNPAVDEGGIGGQITCFNCLSEGKGSGKGFRLSGSAVTGLFVDCVCLNRANGFYTENNATGKIINCRTGNVTSPKTSNITAIETTIVT